LKPKTWTDVITRWRVTRIAGPIAAEEAEKPENAPLRRSFEAGATFTFDQLGSTVKGTVKFPNGNTGVIFGHAGNDFFHFDWFDGVIKGQARLDRQKDGSWHGGVWHERYEFGTPPTHDLTLK
jgi:hypothetical protein